MTKSLEFYLPFSSMRYLASRAGHFYPLFSSNFENFHHNLQFSLSLTFSKWFFFLYRKSNLCPLFSIDFDPFRDYHGHIAQYLFISYPWLQIITQVINHNLGNKTLGQAGPNSITQVMIYNEGQEMNYYYIIYHYNNWIWNIYQQVM